MRMAVEVFQGQPGHFRLDVLTKAEYRALRHAGHDVGEQPLERRAQEVNERRQAKDPAQHREVDAMPWHDVGASDEVRDLALPVGAELRYHLRLGQPGRQVLAEHAVKDDVDRVADDLRPDHRKGDAAQGQQGGDHDPNSFGAQPGQQLA